MDRQLLARMIAAPRESSATSIAAFLTVWFGQVISVIGSGLTGFALGVWTYQQNGSVTQLSIIAVCNRLPAIVISPLAGVMVDRLDRRLILILCQLGSAASILSLALALVYGHLPLWHICIALTINSALSAFQWPAFSAVTTLLVPKKHFGRASGLIATGEALGQILSPLLGGLLIVSIRIQGIFLADFVTFILAFATLLAVRIPRTLKHREAAEKPHLFREFIYGWTYVSSRPGLLGLLIFFALTNFLGGFLMVLTMPLVLSFATGSVLGSVLSIGGSGLLIGGLVMSAWGGPQHRMKGIFIFEIVGGLCLVLAGLRPSTSAIAIAAFCFYFTRPFINGCSQAIWRSKIPIEVQGRVFAVCRMLAWSALPIAYLIAGPLADYVFEPLLLEGGTLAGSVGRVIGTGPGRGIGLLFILLGLLNLLMVGVGNLFSRMRRLEDELKDCIPDAIQPEWVNS